MGKTSAKSELTERSEKQIKVGGKELTPAALRLEIVRTVYRHDKAQADIIARAKELELYITASE